MTQQPLAEPIVGTDRMMLHFESPDTAFHTLKLAVLDTADRGRPVTLDEVAAVAPTYLGVTPHLTQVVEKRNHRWFWVDADVDLAHHLDERSVSGPTGLDDLCGELAATQLDRSRPLWALTLVHGLPGGRQAVVARIHHAIMDGSASMNTFTALTTDTPGTPPPVPVRRPTEPETERVSVPGKLRGILAATREQSRRTKAYGPGGDIPRSIMKRSRFNPRSGATRVCASTSVALEDLKELAALTGSNTNGALHGTITRATRKYLLLHGENPTTPMVANFGVVADITSKRCDGNRLATARVWMPVEDDDALRAVRRAATSCRESVALRRARGFDLQAQAAEFAKFIPDLRVHFVDLFPFTPIHMLTAYVVGPPEDRWFGDVKAVGFTSFAISVAPTDLSITAYSYGGRMGMGVVVTPEAMPDPHVFLGLFEESLAELLTLARAEQGQGEHTVETGDVVAGQ